MTLRGVLLLVFVPAACWPVIACECAVSFGACTEVRVSDLAFIGAVQSIQPIFLNRWYGANQTAMTSLNDAFSRAQEQPSADSLRQVKDAYLATFPQLDERQKRLLASAGTIRQLISLMDSVLDRGMRVHFQVKAIYKHDDDDAARNGGAKDPKDDDDKGSPGFLDVWTSAGDCGYDFQLGETYLVYANDEEGADYYFTSSCMRTKRLSEAGEDLAYLYFYKNQPEASSRLEGFATSDWNGLLAIDPTHQLEAVRSPVSGVIFQLRSDGFTRYSESDSNGRFTFDGLPNGSYDLTAFAPGYPKPTQLLAGPRRLAIKERSCVQHVFVLPKPGG